MLPTKLSKDEQRKLVYLRAKYKYSFHEFFRASWPYIDPAEFVDGWHLSTICDKMQQFAKREIRNIVFNIPPRHCKSLLISVAFPAWVWTWNPKAQFLYASYAESLATRDSVKCRRLVESDWYQWHFGDTVQLAGDQNQKQFYQTTAGGHRQITTPEAATTGLGGDFLLADDPHNVAEAESEAVREKTLSWWFEAMSSRLNDPKTGCKGIIMQRVHERDLAGEAIKRGYYHVVFPGRYEPDHPNVSRDDIRTDMGQLLWPERFDEESLTQLEKDMGEYAAAGQIQQRPTPREGGMFKHDYFQVVDYLPSDMKYVRRWDLAASSKTTQKADPDWTVAVKMGMTEELMPDLTRMRKFYITDVIRFREEPHKVEAAILNTAHSIDGKDVRVGLPEDPGQAGKDQAERYVRMLSGYMVEAERETGDKQTRAFPFAAQCGAKNVFLLRGAWNDAFITELCGFPNGAHDDQVDAASGAFRLLTGTANTGMLDFYKAEFRKDAEEKRKERIEDYARRNGYSSFLGMTAEQFLLEKNLTLPA